MSGRVLFTGGVLLDQFRLHESYTQIGTSDRTSADFVNFGVPATYLSDDIATRGQLSLGFKKINAKGHSIAFNIFAGRNKWSRKKLVSIDTEEFNEFDFEKIDVPVYIGVATQNSFGLNVTKSFDITKEETRLKAYLGARAEGIYTIQEYSADLDGEFAKDRSRVELSAVFVPEVVYFFPGDKFAMSIGLNLSAFGVDINNEEIFNSNLTDEERISNYAAFDFVNLAKTRFEMGFSWLL